MMNKELELPFVPQRIAVISSASAAGYGDFIRQLKENQYGYVFYTALFEAIMQGTETEQSVIRALERISQNAELFDVVVIIRGGGSQSDLSWFDNYNIAYFVTQFPLPVITGIGHERDMSVTDMVAFRSLKTPTAVADFLIGSVSEAEDYLNQLSTQIAENTRSVFTRSTGILLNHSEQSLFLYHDLPYRTVKKNFQTGLSGSSTSERNILSGQVSCRRPLLKTYIFFRIIYFNKEDIPGKEQA